MNVALGKLRGAWPQLAALIMVLVIDWLIFPAFFNVRLVVGRLTGSFIDVLIRGAPVALLALGMAGVIATRGIDLSVGAIMAIAGAVQSAADPFDADDPVGGFTGGSKETEETAVAVIACLIP